MSTGKFERRKVTKADAEKVLAAVKRQRAAWLGDGMERPDLMDRDDHWEVTWEGGPHEWPFLFPHGGVDEEFGSKVGAVSLPAGVFVEPDTHYSIGVYPS